MTKRRKRLTDREAHELDVRARMRRTGESYAQASLMMGKPLTAPSPVSVGAVITTSPLKHFLDGSFAPVTDDEEPPP